MGDFLRRPTYLVRQLHSVSGSSFFDQSDRDGGVNYQRRLSHGDTGASLTPHQGRRCLCCKLYDASKVN
jgi:hypothetical protein